MEVLYKCPECQSIFDEETAQNINMSCCFYKNLEKLKERDSNNKTGINFYFDEHDIPIVEQNEDEFRSEPIYIFGNDDDEEEEEYQEYILDDEEDIDEENIDGDYYRDEYNDDYCGEDD